MSGSVENGEAKKVKHSDWDSALAGTPVVETTKEPEVQEEPKEPEVSEQPAKEEIQAPAPEEKEALEVTAPTEEKKPVDVPLSALMAEREKAKEWKQKYEEAQKSSQGYQETQTEYNQPTNYYDDPAQAIATVEKNLNNQILQMKASISEQMARSTLPDYQDKLQVFYKYAQQNPSYVEQVQASENPALMAYKLGKQWDFQEKYGTDPEQIRAKMMEEVKAELSKEKSSDTSRRAAAAAKQPTNVQGMRQAGGTAMPEFRPSSFSDVLGR